MYNFRREKGKTVLNETHFSPPLRLDYFPPSYLPFVNVGLRNEVQTQETRTRGEFYRVSRVFLFVVIIIFLRYEQTTVQDDRRKDQGIFYYH